MSEKTIIMKFDDEEQQKVYNGILHDSFFALDVWDGEVKKALSERLDAVNKLFSDSPEDYELYSLLAVGGIYAVELKEESAEKIRNMLFDLWREACLAVCGEDSVNELKNMVRAIIAKNVVYAAKSSVNINVSYDGSGDIKYTYSTIDIKDAAGNTILLPGWRLVDQEYLHRWILLHYQLNESQILHSEEDEDVQEQPYIERCDMDISELLCDMEADEFENPEEEIEPGESFDVTYEDTLPSIACRIPEAEDIFFVRSYRPRQLNDLRHSVTMY